MPRLLNPNPGEAADRQTILELKLHYGSGGAEGEARNQTKMEKRGIFVRTVVDGPVQVNLIPFENEITQIRNYMNKSWSPMLDEAGVADYDKLYDELADVNEQIWKLTDQAHTLMNAPDKAQETANARAAEVLYLTIELNDKRASLVRQINQLFNINFQEKIFA